MEAHYDLDKLDKVTIDELWELTQFYIIKVDEAQKRLTDLIAKRDKLIAERMRRLK